VGTQTGGSRAGGGAFDGDWGKLVAKLALAGIESGSLSRIREEVTLDDLTAIYRAWEEEPPIHWFAAGYFKYRPKKSEPMGTLEDFIAAMVNQ
jgi:hypothetical protein